MRIAGSTLPASNAGELPLIVDSSGLALRGGGEWLFEKRGTMKRRAWRKLLIVIDADGREIVALHWQGAYHPTAVRDAIIAGSPHPRHTVPPCNGSMRGPAAATSPNRCDEHILAFQAHGL